MTGDRNISTTCGILHKYQISWCLFVFSLEINFKQVDSNWLTTWLSKHCSKNRIGHWCYKNGPNNLIKVFFFQPPRPLMFILLTWIFTGKKPKSLCEKTADTNKILFDSASKMYKIVQRKTKNPWILQNFTTQINALR